VRSVSLPNHRLSGATARALGHKSLSFRTFPSFGKLVAIVLFVRSADVYGNITILVVEDAEAIRRMVCAMLAQQGYQCLEAEDGVDALRMLDETAAPVHLVLTDVIMPKMTGAELGRHLVRLRPDLRIVFMSGYCDDPMVRNLERVPLMFLAKPFTAATLLEKVRQALDQPWHGLPDIASNSARR
jgi:CheY-like chemotaxis protein